MKTSSVSVVLARAASASAFSSGCVSACVRVASWSASVLVAVFSFPSAALAGAFASSWAARLGVGVRVRRVGGLFSVGLAVSGA